MRILRTKQFDKKFSKLPKQIQEKALQRLALFASDPHNWQLRNHALQGMHAGTRSIDVTGDVRIHFEEADSGVVWLLLIGTHHELYGK